MSAYINGKLVAPANCAKVPVVNPANGQTIGHVVMADAAVMRQAIDAAAAASVEWGRSRAADRERILLRAAEVVEARQQEIIDVLIDEAGSTLGKTLFEVTYTAGLLRSAAGEARRINGQVLPSDAPETLSFVIRRPLGVIAAISPFNYPFLLSTKKVCMALAAGNTVVLKPSEETSLIGLKIAEIFEAAGLPPGVLNVVPGDGPTVGQVILDDPRVKLVSFTGSTSVGRALAVECAKRGKRITLEMGGKSPVVVLKDADVDYAVNTAIFGMFAHQGQICMAGTRVIVEAPIYASFVERFVKKAQSLQLGDPRDIKTVIGPLIRRSQCGFIADLVAKAKDQGARLLCGGTYQDNFFAATVLADVTPDMDVFRQELFGPVASLIEARDADHALELANDSCYGLSSAVLTNDLQMAMKFAQELEAGMVHINSSTVDDEPHAPFGGVKDSGLGREGGHWSMDELTETKWVTIQQGRREYPF